MSEEFWDQRLGLARQIVSRGIERGEIPEGTDPITLLETLIGPLYLRLLVTREPIDLQLVERIVDLLLGGPVPLRLKGASFY